MATQSQVSRQPFSTASGTPRSQAKQKLKMNKIFRDITKVTMAKPKRGELYDHDPMVKMNDYTKNIS